MTDIGDLVHRLRNTPVRDIIRAVERDGFSLKRETATGARIYAHPDVGLP
jgi:predicted RNA binding protein YcfA (HicA-like mRNA interferase family)